MTFQEKVENMKGSEILQAMLDGLENEWVPVDMNHYGHAYPDEKSKGRKDEPILL